MKNVLMIAVLSLCLSNMQAQMIDEGSMKKAAGWVSELQLGDKAKNELYFTNSGRDWHTMYRTYVQKRGSRCWISGDFTLIL